MRTYSFFLPIFLLSCSGDEDRASAAAPPMVGADSAGAADVAEELEPSEAAGGDSSATVSGVSDSNVIDWAGIFPETNTWSFINALDHYGSPLTGVVSEGQFVALASREADLDVRGPIIDLQGRTLVPGFIDSHVHLSYFDGRAALQAGGVFAAIDLAAPLLDLLPRSLSADFYLVSAGPMVTSIAGYPTRSWGRNGYGLEVADVATAEATVEDLILEGAGLIKVPLDGPNSLSQELLERVVLKAHQEERLVVAHALSTDGYNRARRAGVDGLAHTPTTLMTPSEATEWRGGFVLSTLYAFGASDNAIQNIRLLESSGVTVLYGTDLGNRIVSGIDTIELELLREILELSPAEAIELATSEPADLWQLPVGRIEPGYDASFLIVDADGINSLDELEQPEALLHRGRIK